MRISDWSSDVCSSDLKQGKITMADDRRVYLFDSTLRDGAQTQGVDFTVPDKLAIARALDRLGVDYVEGGWPGANPTDDAFFGEPPEFAVSQIGRASCRERGLQYV